MSFSPFTSLPMAARDPILGLNETFAADPRPNKVNLGMGVYSDDTGKIPLLAAVKQAEAQLNAANMARGYLPIDGIVKYNLAVQTLLFGSDSPLVKHQRVATVQALGGTGALKVGADLLRRFVPDAQVW
ncbi:MAG: aminotransferase class I/II-fold pyridoxal phosphate-dependent enzyme, partial [Burkholderiales bacterium]